MNVHNNLYNGYDNIIMYIGYNVSEYIYIKYINILCVHIIYSNYNCFAIDWNI